MAKKKQKYYYLERDVKFELNRYEFGILMGSIDSEKLRSMQHLSPILWLMLQRAFVEAYMKGHPYKEQAIKEFKEYDKKIKAHL